MKKQELLEAINKEERPEILAEIEYLLSLPKSLLEQDLDRALESRRLRGVREGLLEPAEVLRNILGAR